MIYKFRDIQLIRILNDWEIWGSGSSGVDWWVSYSILKTVFEKKLAEAIVLEPSFGRKQPSHQSKSSVIDILRSEVEDLVAKRQYRTPGGSPSMLTWLVLPKKHW
jgi:hypothetical protein